MDVHDGAATRDRHHDGVRIADNAIVTASNHCCQDIIELSCREFILLSKDCTR